MLFCIIPSLCGWWFSGDVRRAEAQGNKQWVDNQVNKGTSIYLTAYLDAATRAAGTAFPPTVTPTITPSPIPTLTSTPSPAALPQLTFRLSFYDPNIGKDFPDKAWVNCLEWDDVAKECLSHVNNGVDDYHLWYRRGAACSAPLSIGQRFRVLSPPELAVYGIWTCIDRGGAIVGDYIDFMLDYPADIWTGYNLDYFPWSSPVIVELQP